MSVNFNKPYEVDVPVMDLDDPGDDALFSEANRKNSHRFMDFLDYAQPDADNGGYFQKIGNFFRKSPRSASYELMDDHSDTEFFNVDDDQSSEEPDLRKYQIKRLERKLNSTILCFACGLVFVFAFLFFRKDALGSSPSAKILLSNSTHTFHPTTLMISLDGFHPHYISAENTPALHKMLVEGYGAPYMEPSFPSSTFPNHWTLVTGLYPADHGIVGNTFYDPVLQKQFINTNPDFGLDPDFWQGGEPIWTTAAKQGVTSAIHMWPGSEVPTVGDNGPLFIDRYNGTEPLSSKVDRIFGWLDTPDLGDRPELVLAYVPTIDQYGHKYGISGPELRDSLRYVDEFVSLAQEKLAERNLHHIVNMVVVSDHGMAPTSNNRLLFLDDVVDLGEIEHIDGWPLFGLRPKSSVSVDKVYEEIQHNLEAASTDTQENFRVLRVEDFPPEWQFGGKVSDHTFNYRLAPLWIVPNVGYSVTTRAKFEENNNDYYPKGVHGYNNTHLLMRAIFLGQGPYFERKLAKNKKVLPFTNVNVYNIICDTLQIRPSANNGTASGKSFSISSSKYLPDDWTDDLVYPDLPFEVEHVVRNATYDQLWRSSKATIEEPGDSYENVYSSLKSFESSMPNPEPSLPKPSDFSKVGASPTLEQSSGVSTPTREADETSQTAESDDGSEETENSGFFGHFLGSVGNAIDDLDKSFEGVVEDAMDYAESWLDDHV